MMSIKDYRKLVAYEPYHTTVARSPSFQGGTVVKPNQLPASASCVERYKPTLDMCRTLG